MKLIDRTVTEIGATLDAGQARSVDLVEQWIARTTAAATLNCYTAFDAVGLRRQAAAADARRASGQRLPLLGIPVALKDNIESVGLPCGDGTGALHGQLATRDAVVVQRLRAAGALIAGKLGMHELALGITNHNAVTGAVRNPWDHARIPGGSSGGSGAAVAARLVPASIGTDTGGSVRIPAALCGVAGLRPTVGRVSRSGVAPIALTRDTPGPLARSVADLALLDAVLSGEDMPVSTVALRGLRLGVPHSPFWDDLDPGVARLANAALQTLRAAGVDLVDVKLPEVAHWSEEIGFVIVQHEFLRDMHSYLAERACGVDFPQLIAGIASADVRPLVQSLLQGPAVSETAYAQALQTRRQLQDTYARAFAEHDIGALVFPTTPSRAARIGEDQSFIHNHRPCPTFATFIRNTDPGSNAGIPGLSLPIGLADGLPVGLALDGPAGSDRRLLALGMAVEAALPPMPLCPSWN